MFVHIDSNRNTFKLIMSFGEGIGKVFAVIILLCVLFECTTAGPSKDYSKICINHPPTKTSKTNNESKWTNEDKTAKRHLHFASKNMQIRLASVLKGIDVDDTKEDYSKMCPAAIINYLQGHAELDFFGYGTKISIYVCYVMKGDTGALDCTVKHENGYGIKAILYPHYDSRITVTTWCFDDGDVGWIVWSTHDDLTPEEEKTTMDYLSSIGFDTSKRIPMTAASCTNKFKQNDQ